MKNSKAQHCLGFLVNGRVADVRFGSKADMTLSYYDVCFTPESGHRSVNLACRLCAKSRPEPFHSIIS